MRTMLRAWGDYLGRYSGLVGLAFFWLIVDFGVRVWLLVYSAVAVSWEPWVLLKMLAVGFVFDLAVVAQGVIPLVFYLMIVPKKLFAKKWHRWVLLFLIAFASGLMIFGGLSEFFFWQEFQNRFNFIAVDYLIYTNEVVKNIWESYPIIPLITVLALCAAGVTWLLNRYFLSWETEIGGGLRGAIFLGCLFCIGISFFGMDGRYKNISANAYNNQLAGNGLYELFSAFRNNKLDYEQFYRTLPEGQEEIFLKQALQASDGVTMSMGDWNITREIKGAEGMKRPNVVMITVESLSSDFVGVYGNTEGLTPNLDRLSQDSLWFTRLYATGTRTVRGLEALSLAIPPTPGQSIVRRPGNDNLFTLGSVFESKGYTTNFLYGGYGYFDNMNDFFADNGYRVTDRTDISAKDIIMENAWGVADEVVFNEALRVMDQDYAAGQPSFQMILTTSNHRPFTYPDGRIDIPSPGDRAGAVKYTDWAIGNFIEEARKKPWFKDTVFVIVADHQADSAGKTEVPILRYHIPLLIYAPELIQPGKVDTLMSQIDVAPTLLGLLQFSYSSRFMGYDVMKIAPDQGRIFISTYQSLGYARGDELVVLNPQQKVSSYRIDYDTGEYTRSPENPAMLQEAIYWYQGASKLYEEGHYRAIGK